MRTLIAALLLAACAPSGAQPLDEQWRAVEVRAEPVQLGADTVGQLRFRGGIALSADEEVFGGFSGLEVIESGRLVAISDDGQWLEAQLLLDADGDLIGIENARMAAMRDERGNVLPYKRVRDAEGLAQLPDGRFAVSFEQTHVIRIYDLNRDGPFGAAVRGPRLEGARRLPGNSGLEALAATDDGALLAGAEGGLTDAPLWLAPIDAREPAPSRATYTLRGGYSLTGLDRSPLGSYVALERFYAPVLGAHARITQIDPGEGAMQPEELALLTPPLALDNFESISAVRYGDGVRLYIMSDDNFSARQRTLIYAFDVLDTAD